MADVGNQIALQLAGARHLPRHGVKILCKHGQLVVPARGNARGIIALCHTPRRARKLGDGPGKPAAEQKRAQNAHAKRDSCNDRKLHADDIAGLLDAFQVCRDNQASAARKALAHHHLALGAALFCQNEAYLAVLAHCAAQGKGVFAVPIGLALLSKCLEIRGVDQAFPRLQRMEVQHSAP